ncbi:hypothetical protein U27_03536 [Candidatus Vecturithrix granuli]|uniref:AAA-ATPase-like domain-containing protein n=1 Tax=Vecturithrix granuli TaxID=1499967 RepID=A0A081BW69_VECG1|nr:hypothetical protein U27_03536 [Candidatus Vecturithrix granuli]
MMKLIPYGQSNYKNVATQNFYYVDKTRYIELLEQMGTRFLVFLRPRRFGKSLFVSMLQHYYDCNRAEEFEALFGQTYIGRHPTPLRNAYPVLFFTFSGIKTYGTIEDTITSFNLSVHAKIRTFLTLNKTHLEITDQEGEKILSIQDGGDQLRELIDILNLKAKTFYLMIDEYDNFGNNILTEYGKARYLEVTHGVGFLRNFFAVIKDGTRDGKIERLFVTGVSPLVLADVTSGFNIGTNISLFPALNAMIGFTRQETDTLIDYYVAEGGIKAEDRQTCLDIMADWYDGYVFSPDAQERVYNSDMVLYFVNQYQMYGRIPPNILDENVRIDYGKLKYLIFLDRQLNGNFEVLHTMLEQGQLAGRFVFSIAVGEEIDQDKFVSLLYFLGLTTILSADQFVTTFIPPNKLIRQMLWGYIRQAAEDAYNFHVEMYKLHQYFKDAALHGEWNVLLTYILEKFYQAASARDFVFHEEGVKMLLLAYLNLADMYRVESEKAFEQGYSDIFLYPDVDLFPDVRYSYIFELKYLKSRDINTEKKKQAQTEKALFQAKQQLARYMDAAAFKRPVKKVAIVLCAHEVLAMEEIAAL